ncbi:hypothetical protein FH587_04645 (plasmid) [Leptospira interrogans]|uniref:hypothetical protein n=1 Tax=Leptospira interrogans TaxID=173 RepID=UPI001F07AA6D|nr:hypothetical protein [Leptospira interrogans]UML83132.1 hypothetical protein FH587_04645 [Leptospira interrogans]
MEDKSKEKLVVLIRKTRNGDITAKGNESEVEEFLKSGLYRRLTETEELKLYPKEEKSPETQKVTKVKND